MRNVALIVLDSVRKDVFDEYAPRLGAYSDVSFRQCRAASSWSAPSHWSMLTGELPHRHGVHAERLDATFGFDEFDRDETVLGDLPDHEVVGMSANPYMNSTFGFDAHFDAFHDFSVGSTTTENLFNEGLSVQRYMRETDEPDPAKRYLGFLAACLDHEAPVKSVANGVWSQVGPLVRRLPVPEPVDDGARNIVDTATEQAGAVDEPWFFFMNLMDAHTPLRNLRQFDQSLHSVPDDWSSTELDKWELNQEGLATEEYERNYRELYAAAVDYLDRVVSDCVGRIQRATDRETTVVVLSDHGHNLGYPADRELFHHTRSMTEAVLHTPLEIINPPAGYPGTVDGYVSHVSLPDLLVDLAYGEEFDDGIVKERIAAELVGLVGAGSGDLLWRTDFEEDGEFWNRMIRCAYDRDGTRKFQWNSLGDSYEYELDPDRPSWQREAAAGVEIPAAARELFDVDIQQFKEHAADISQDMEFEGAVEDQLKDLGYL